MTYLVNKNRGLFWEGQNITHNVRVNLFKKDNKVLLRSFITDIFERSFLLSRTFMNVHFLSFSFINSFEVSSTFNLIVLLSFIYQYINSIKSIQIILAFLLFFRSFFFIFMHLLIYRKYPKGAPGRYRWWSVIPAG